MQPPNLAPASPIPLNLSQSARLTEALTKGGMPELFFPSVFAVVAQILGETVREDRLVCGGDPFARRTSR